MRILDLNTVVITLLGCAEFIILVWIRLSTYWVLRWPHGVHWYLQMLYLWGYFCVKLPYFVMMSLGLGGYLSLSNSYTVTVAWLWEVFRLFAVGLGLTLVWSVKWTVICVEMRFHLLNDCRQFPAVGWLWSLLDLVNLFRLKILSLPVGVWSLDWLAGTCHLWGRFEILYSYVNGALHLRPYHLWWDFILLCFA